MIQVRRLGHATFETPDVQRQAEYYAEVIGLQVHRDGNRAILATGLGEEAVSSARQRGPPAAIHFRLRPTWIFRRRSALARTG
jgi:catechol-2,3-dioxygenase